MLNVVLSYIVSGERDSKSGGRGLDGSRGSDSREQDEEYAEIAAAMEVAFVEACGRRPSLTREQRFIALLLLKDRILERYLVPDTLAPELALVARKLYQI